MTPGLDMQPSTSKTSNCEYSDKLVETVFDFEKLAIDNRSPSTEKIKLELSLNKLPEMRDKISFNRHIFFTKRSLLKRTHYAPYSVPLHIRLKFRPARRHRRSSSYDIYSFSSVSLDGDVEPLKMRLIDRKDQGTPCSVQAARPPSPVDDIDELTEYFEHFVRVGLKMSALAESMYV